ncbi:MAG: TonB-dependent receptor, partial [Undibacterium sp.]|nr:TonB-dependent receptor [Undibacterium sp.]
EVNITGTAEQNYVVKRSVTATKTDTLLLETPQAVTVISKELMRDQAMQSMADVVRYVPGIVTAQGEGNRETAGFRGNSSTGDFYVDGIRDDVQYYRDFYNIDSVEALKGSNAMIFGRGGSGGVINRVTKQAEWRSIHEASLTLGSWNNRRVTADVGQVISENAALRVSAMVEDSDSYRQQVNLQRSGINPTLALRVGENTSVVLGYEHFKDERTADRGIPSFQARPFSTDSSTFFGNPDLSQTWSKADAFSALIEHDFGQGWTLRNRTRYASYDKFYQNVFPGAVNAAGTMVALSAYNNATQRDNFFNQTDLMTTMNIGGMRHKLVAGLEIGQQETDNFRNTGYFSSVAPNATSISVPVSSPTINSSNATVTFRQSATDANNHSKADIVSVYLQDQIEIAPQWQAIIGVRYDHFSVDFTNNRTLENIQVTDTPVSPRAGLVYKPLPEMSLYASYSLAYAPRAGDQLSSLTASNKAFDPEQFKNLELGAKWDIRPDLTASAAVYQLDRSNVAIADPLDVTKTIL